MENIEKKTPLNDLMDTTMDKIRDMVDSNTIIGEPITTPDGVTVIPVSRVSFGFGAGGGDYGKTDTAHFGGGAGAGVSLDLHGELLRGDNGHVQRFLIGAVFLYLIDENLHLALEDGVFLLSSRNIIGDLLKEIINGGHVIAAYAGFLKSLFTDILCSDHILIHLSSILLFIRNSAPRSRSGRSACPEYQHSAG